ncbi:hypothetical protein GYMLUDRAFT_58804 [Collybiopsis luxurians FD-317 M1]|uniref:Uncharacterized protein n=1 Tax=Collybiopsis luxurians FD-317 M1 TaxID=944289 RepID=A0A0D0CRD1_9AGAR|nr:hypothetical protein GYMLUDRAFT_58804 [Collybiopsis luxurians FD-317 M1]
MSVSGVLSGLPSPHSPAFPHIQAMEKTARDPPPVIDPITSLELRLRLLESLVVGLDPDEKGKQELKNETLTKSAENIKRIVNQYVEGNDTLRRFINHYELYERFLTPAFALGLLEEPAYETMSSADLVTYLRDMEPEIRSADSGMQEIEALLRKGAAEAGKLPIYVDLEPRLKALLELQQENKARADALEARVANIMENHATYIDALSELFVAWDDAIMDAENRVAKMERMKEERKRLGLE